MEWAAAKFDCSTVLRVVCESLDLENALGRAAFETVCERLFLVMGSGPEPLGAQTVVVQKGWASLIG